METRYIFVTGGVASSLGKGIISASLARLLLARGYRVTIQKFDPYINIDPGTLNPYEHGECYVTIDGRQADLDLGHYVIEFSPAAREEIAVLCAATDEILDLTEVAYIGNDITLAYNIEPLEQVIDNLKTLLRNNHISRLKEGSCTVETGFIWSDLITNFERVSDHCSNVAIGIIDVSEHTMNAHEVVKSLKAGNTHYNEKLEEYSKKYTISLKS